MGDFLRSLSRDQQVGLVFLLIFGALALVTVALALIGLASVAVLGCCPARSTYWHRLSGPIQPQWNPTGAHLGHGVTDSNGQARTTADCWISSFTWRNDKDQPWSTSRS